MHKNVTEKTHMCIQHCGKRTYQECTSDKDTGDHANRANMYRRTSVLKRLQYIEIDKCATMFF